MNFDNSALSELWSVLLDFFEVLIMFAPGKALHVYTWRWHWKQGIAQVLWSKKIASVSVYLYFPAIFV